MILNLAEGVMRQGHLIAAILLLFLSTFKVFAGGPDFDNVSVGAPTITCSGNVSISISLDWNYATTANWSLTVDGSLISSGTVNRANPIDTFTLSGLITPKNDPSVTVDLRLQSNGGIGYDQTFSQFTSASICPASVQEEVQETTIVMCDDGRINSQCDTVAIYPIEDFEGIHMQVWYVLPGDGSNGRFAFMLYRDELDALPENTPEALLVASSEDNFIKLYWLPDNSFQLTAGPDGEGKPASLISERFREKLARIRSNPKRTALWA
jgi:hypothetical protein